MRLDRVTVAAVHAAPAYLDLRGSVERAAELVREAAAGGARLIVFPEAFLPGFPYWINVVTPVDQRELYLRLWESSLDLSAPEVLDPVLRAAAQARVVIVLGANERSGGTIYNAQVVIDGANGIVHTRRKLVPTSFERTVWGWGPSDVAYARATSVGTVSTLMCWEHAMSGTRQRVVETGPQLHAAAWPGLASVHGIGPAFTGRVEVLVRSHALMTQSFVVSAMSPVSDEIAATFSTGSAAGLVEPGPAWSTVVDPFGQMIAEKDGADDGILLADVDLRQTIAAKHLLDPAGHSAPR